MAPILAGDGAVPSFRRPPWVAQYVPSINGSQGWFAEPDAGCAAAAWTKPFADIPSTIKSAKRCRFNTHLQTVFPGGLRRLIRS